MNQLRMTRTTSYLLANWSKPRGQDSYLCGAITDQYVDIPSHVKTLYMVFHEKRVPDSFKFRVKYPDFPFSGTSGQSMVISGTKGASLFFHLEIRLSSELREGRSYFTLEYNEA